MAATKETPAPSGIDEVAAEERNEKLPVKSRFPLKLIIIVAVAALALGSAGGGAYFLLAHRSASAEAAGAKAPVFFDMPDVLVNLSSTGDQRTQYLKVKAVLELPNKAVEAQIRTLMPRLLDTFQAYLRELRPTDLNGSAGLYRLKEALTRRVNAEIAPRRINAVLFKEIVVQ